MTVKDVMVEVVSQLLDVGEKTVLLKAEAYCEGVVILTKGDNDGQRKKCKRCLQVDKIR